MMASTRGQSETVGIVLLTAVIVVLASVVGVFILANFEGSDETEQTVDVRSAVDGQNVTISHFGGASYAAAEIRIVIRQQGSGEISLPLSEFTHDGDRETFEAGDRWKSDFDSRGETLSGEIRLLVVAEDEGRVVHQASYVVS